MCIEIYALFQFVTCNRNFLMLISRMVIESKLSVASSFFFILLIDIYYFLDNKNYLIRRLFEFGKNDEVNECL